MSHSDPLFDEVPDRRGRNSLKWGKYEGRDVLPLWVADMDYRSPPQVIEVAKNLAEFGNFGYGKPSPALTELVIERMESLHDWQIQPNWLVWLPGMVCGFNIAIRAMGKEGDEVLSNIPVYPPFLMAPGNFGQNLAGVPMILEEARHTMDFDGLVSAISPQSKTFLFCHPHNPVGTQFTRHELERFAEFCLRYDLGVCSDEIHCDLLLDPGAQHLPLATISPEIADKSITLMAPSKTFNLPGFGCSFAIISNPELRLRYKKACKGIVPDPPAMGFSLAEAAYRHGEPWRQRLLKYLRANRDLALGRLAAIPDLLPFPLSATYLLWIDARDLAVENPQRFFEEAGVGLSDGADFGSPGFLRLNLGCARALLEQALDRMERAVRNR